MEINELFKPKTSKEIIKSIKDEAKSKKYKKTRIGFYLLNKSIRLNFLEGVKYILEKDKDILYHGDYYFLKLAITLNFYDIVKYMINKLEYYKDINKKLLRELSKYIDYSSKSIIIYNLFKEKYHEKSRSNK